MREKIIALIEQQLELPEGSVKPENRIEDIDVF